MKPHLISLFILLFMTIATQADEPVRPTVTIIGGWHGEATLDYDWTHHKTFPVLIVIHADGTVSGTIGEAVLTKAKFMRHRPMNRPDLKDMTDYMITGKLVSLILTTDKFTASEVFIPLDFTHGKLDGGVNTHGSTVDDKPMGIICADLTLSKNK